MPTGWQKLWMRRTFIVDPGFQGAVIARSLLSAGFLLLVILGGLFLPLMIQIAGSESAHPLDASAVASAFLYLHEHLLPLLGVYFVFAVLSAIRFSHRIAGPMVRFKRDIYAIGDGHFPAPLRTRPDDYMKAEVRALNDMSQSLAQRARDIRDAQMALQETLHDCASRIELARDAQLMTSFERLQEEARILSERVAFFELEEAALDLESESRERESSRSDVRVMVSASTDESPDTR
jgi:nitrate/nitrite-specific signal transduction histidine kinase